MASTGSARPWWIAGRAWALAGATVVAWILRLSMPPGHRHILSDEVVGGVTGISFITAALGTAWACRLDLRDNTLEDRWHGTRALGLASLSVVLNTGAWGTVLLAMTRSKMAPRNPLAEGLVEGLVLIGCLAGGVGALWALAALGRDRARLRAAAALAVAVIGGGALAGVSLPVFSKNIAEALSARARQDLDTLSQQITLHDSQNRPLTGTRFDPLLGRYLQEIPRDPWGEPYLLDSCLGVVLSLGADKRAGGYDDDADIIMRYKPTLGLWQVRLEGPWGVPQPGHKLRLRWTKPFVASDPAGVPGDLVLILDPRRRLCLRLDGNVLGPDPPTALGEPPIAIGPDLEGIGWNGIRWAYASALSDPTEGSMVLECHPDPLVVARRPLSLTVQMALNVSSRVLVTKPEGEHSRSVIREAYVPGGPLDPKTTGPTPPVLADGAHPLPMFGRENLGTPIEGPRAGR